MKQWNDALHAVNKEWNESDKQAGRVTDRQGVRDAQRVYLLMLAQAGDKLGGGGGGKFNLRKFLKIAQKVA